MAGLEKRPPFVGPTASEQKVPTTTREARAQGSAFKKAPPPQLGEAFGQVWHNDSKVWNRLPGGGIIQFDLNQLTLSDFRAMRDHYQINASLSVLMFLMHQLDWKIVSDNAKIAKACQANMDEVWTRMVRALSQSFWAGYSPNILQWENDIDGRAVKLTKIKDLIPELCDVNWLEVDGWAPPGKNPPKLKVYDGIQQYGLGWPIPPENCVTPDTKILCSDFQWRNAGDLKPGDEIIAFDEEPTAASRTGAAIGTRRYKKAIIEVNKPGRKECYEVGTEFGKTIIATADHPWLVWKGKRESSDPNGGGTRYALRWVNTRDLKEGDEIAWFANPWKRDESRSAGWLAGMFDGEGCLSVSGRGEGDTVTLTIAQRESSTLDKIKAELTARDYEFSLRQGQSGLGAKPCWNVTILGGRREIMRFIGEIGPERFTERDLSYLYEGVMVKRNKSFDLMPITWIDNVGEQDIASIQTSARTFITGGYLTHNTLWYTLLKENNNVYGRKLLRPAFTPWYFSILIHMFANRYMERFGEPLPVGRAPMDNISLPNGKKTTGLAVMGEILQNLRNRAVVVLPDDRTLLGTSNAEFDYQIEYLESQMRGADFERYLMRLDEEISLAMFTPLLILRTADVGSYNLGTTHWNVFQQMLNALAGDWAEYIDRYVLAPMVKFNFGMKAKTAHIKFRKLGDEKSQLVITLLQALVSANKADLDLEQLGEIAGLTLSEVKEVTTPPDAPPSDPNADPNAGGDGTGGGPASGDKTSSSNRRQAVGEVRAQISARVAAQLARATAAGDKAIRPDLGFRRQLADALGTATTDSSLGRVYAVTEAVLVESYEAGVPDLAANFDDFLKHQLEALGGTR